MRLIQFVAVAMAAAILSSTPEQAWAAASDNAGNAPYANGWQDGDNGGSGFAGWTSGFSGNPGALAHPSPKFIDNGPLAGNSLGAPAFALTTSDLAYNFDTSEVKRSLSTPLAVGQTLSADIDGPRLTFTPDSFDFDFGTGATFQLCANGVCSGGNERFGLFTNISYNENWTTVGGGAADTGVPSPNSFHLEFTLLPGDTYNLVMTPVGGGAPLFSQLGAALVGPAGAAIDNIRITVYGTGSSADGSKELFFNNLTVVPEPSSLVMLLIASGLVASLRRTK